MSKLDPRIEAVRKQYDLDAGDFWQIPQNKQWVCKHAALEIVAVKAGIEWDMPQIIEADAPGLVTSMVVSGRLGTRAEWATGETNPTNYSVKGKQPAYPWAMSEKRAKDRVVLKLVGIHGLVYSEDEMPAGVADKPAAEPVQNDDRAHKATQLRDDLTRQINDCADAEYLATLGNDVRFKEAVESLPDNNRREVRAAYRVRLTALQSGVDGRASYGEAAE